MIAPIQPYVVLAAGGTITIDSANPPAIVYVSPNTGSATLSGNVAFNMSGAPALGTIIEFIWSTGFTLNGHTFSLNGISISQAQLNSIGFIRCTYIDDAGTHIDEYVTNFTGTSTLPGTILTDNSTPLAKMVNGTSAQIPIVGGGGVLAYTTQSGHVLFSNAGASTIQASVIVDSMVNASAAIARTKLANGTASQIVANDSSGVMTSIALVPPVNGGLGRDASVDTGFVTFNAGAVVIGSSGFSRDLVVSFTAASVGDFKIQMAGSGIITQIYGFVESSIGAATGTITPKNNSGSIMTGGIINVGSADAKGTAYTVNPTANSTFANGDILTFTTAGGSSAGLVHLSISYIKVA